MEVDLFVKEEAEVHHGGPGVVVVEEVQQHQQLHPDSILFYSIFSKISVTIQMQCNEAPSTILESQKWSSAMQ